MFNAERALLPDDDMTTLTLIFRSFSSRNREWTKAVRSEVTESHSRRGVHKGELRNARRPNPAAAFAASGLCSSRAAATATRPAGRGDCCDVCGDQMFRTRRQRTSEVSSLARAAGQSAEEH